MQRSWDGNVGGYWRSREEAGEAGQRDNVEISGQGGI